MKKLLTILFFLLAACPMAYSTTRVVDPAVIPNTIPNTYATFQAAWYSTVNGDTLLLKSGTYDIASPTINRGVTILAFTKESKVTFLGDIFFNIINSNTPINIMGISITGKVSGVTNSNASFIGFKCNGFSLQGEDYLSKINLIDCVVSGDLECFTPEFNIFRCAISGDTRFSHGKMIASKTNNLFLINKLGQQNDILNRNLIIADTITGYFDYRSQDRICVIANNLINELDFYAWNYTVPKENLIWNNEFYNQGRLLFALIAPKYNVDISNNILKYLPNGVYYECYGNSYETSISFNGNLRDRVCNYNYSVINWSNNLNSCPSPNSDVPGIFKWTYNGGALGDAKIKGNYPITNIAGTNDIVDAGNPDPKYMDIDMTVNDRGRLGGPYSILNYEPTVNPSNGKAFIYDIEIPDVINSSSQPIQIKAKGYHRN